MTVTVSVLNDPDYTAQQLRMAWSVPMGAPNLALQARSGVRYTNGGDFQTNVSGLTATVSPGQAVLQSPTFAQGGYTVTSDANVNLTITARHATLTRIDTVYLMVRDDDVDASGAQDGRVLYQAGTAGAGVAPSLTGHTMRLADITVPPGAALITVTDKRQYTAGLGGVIPCRLVADIGNVAPGTLAFELTTNKLWLRDGTAWRNPWTPPGSWTDVPLGWFNGDFKNLTGWPLRYWIDTHGFINMTGRITRTSSGGVLSGSLTGVMQLPVGFRPAVDVLFAAGAAAGVAARINIEPNGGVNLFQSPGVNSVYIAFDSVRFPLFI